MLWYIVLLLVLAVKGETRAPVPDLNKKCHKFVTEGYCEVCVQRVLNKGDCIMVMLLMHFL